MPENGSGWILKNGAQEEDSAGGGVAGLGIAHGARASRRGFHLRVEGRAAADGRTSEQAAAVAAAAVVVRCGRQRMENLDNNLGLWYIYAQRIGPGLGAISRRELCWPKFFLPPKGLYGLNGPCSTTRPVYSRFVSPV